jgi:hypothetical protein
MVKCVEGVYREGKVELLEPPGEVEESRVLVMFLPRSGSVDLRARGIGEAEAAEMRWRVAAIAEDWDRPEMDVYDDI